MQAVILAAGKSTRTHPLTLTRPKPLLEVAGRTILEHNLEQLKGLVDEVMLIVGYKKEMIEELIGEEFQGIKIEYIEQSEQLGTGHALLHTETHIKDRFILMHGDDLYSRQDIQSCLKHQYSILGKEVKNPEEFGVLETSNGKLVGIEEKPKSPPSNLVNAALYALDKKIFQIIKKLPKTKREEYELTDAVEHLAKTEEVMVEKADLWLPISYPWNLLEANEEILNRSKSKIEGTVEKNVTVKGTLILGKGSVIKSGSYIEGNAVIGENCVIGPNTVLRQRGAIAIGNNCKLICSEIIDSIIMDNTQIHRSYVGDSIIGENCNLGAGTVIANLRHDDKSIKVNIKGKLVDSGRRKLGIVMGDGCKTGINTSVYPGRKIWPGKTTRPGEIVQKDLI